MSERSPELEWFSAPPARQCLLTVHEHERVPKCCDGVYITPLDHNHLRPSPWAVSWHRRSCYRPSWCTRDSLRWTCPRPSTLPSREPSSWHLRACSWLLAARLQRTCTEDWRQLRQTRYFEVIKSGNLESWNLESRFQDSRFQDSRVPLRVEWCGCVRICVQRVRVRLGVRDPRCKIARSP